MRVRRCALIATAPLATLALVAAVAAPASAQGGRPLTTTLTGAEEVPGPGDPDGSGTASLTVNPGLGEICYTITAAMIGTTTGGPGAHIHVGAMGQAGPVVVPLVPPPDGGGTSSGCVDVERDLALRILKSPELYYVNVHTLQYLPGAIRGQLGR